jgi:hypothetical protein
MILHALHFAVLLCAACGNQLSRCVATLQVDGRVTRLWKYFFRPGVGTTDRLGIAIPIGDKLDQVQFGHTALLFPAFTP